MPVVNKPAPIPDFTFKDETPHNTVAKIKRILKEYGIEAEESWNESGVPNCHSLRITVTGTAFGVNGKGVTRELALASGYGELMERLQLGYLYRDEQQKSNNLPVDDSINGNIPAKALLERNGNWYSLLAQSLHTHTGLECTGDEILMQYADGQGNVPVTPYYCVTTHSLEYLPTQLRKMVYTANGCAAGNTMEEALVQAISEIVERKYKLRILSEQIALPEIPEAVLKACPIAYDIITFLRSSGFSVVVKDGSLGTKFPVVCVCLIDRNTGRYHTHFGAFPNFEIALERTLTESFQGRSIDKIAKYEDFCKKKDDIYVWRYFKEELVKGTSEKHPGFFISVSPKPYNQEVGFSGTNNRELLRECFAFFREQGHDILVRDCSCLGFPTYQVIIPGYSEIFAQRMSAKHNDMRYHAYAQKVFQNPSSAGIDDIMGLLMHMAQDNNQNAALPNFSDTANIPARLTAEEDRFLTNATLAHVNYTLGRYTDATKYINKLLSAKTVKEEEYLICLKRYLFLLANRYGSEEARQILAYFHRSETVQRIFSCIEENRNPLDPFTLHCQLQCHPECVLYASCSKKRTAALAHLINSRMQQLDFSACAARLESFGE